jgi:hypothetical protein
MALSEVVQRAKWENIGSGCNRLAVPGGWLVCGMLHGQQGKAMTRSSSQTRTTRGWIGG